MTPEQARALFLENCQPGDRGTLERYGEKAAVAAILEAVDVERRSCAQIARNPGFIECRDTEWDSGVNYAKAFIALRIQAQAC